MTELQIKLDEEFRKEIHQKRSKWGIFYRGQMLFLSNSNVYAGEGIAKRKFLETYYYVRYASDDALKKATTEMNELIKLELLEFKKL